MALPGGASRDLNINLNEKRSNPKAFVEAANDLDKLSKGVDATGDKFDAMASDADKLNVEIEKTRAHIKDLATQFAATGDVTLFGDIRRHESHLRNLRKVFDELTEGAHDAGVEVAESFTAGVQGGLRTPGVGPVLVGGLAALAAAAAPGIGAIISGAVIGVATGGGIAGGIGAASKDPGVRTAARQFGDAIGLEFFGSGDSFREPIKDSLEELAADFRRLDLDSAFTKAAPALTILADGVGEFGRNIMPGFLDALERSPEAAAAMADGLGNVGDALGDMMREVSESKGTMDGLRMIFTLTGDVIRTVGNVSGFLADRYHEAAAGAATLTGALEDVTQQPFARVFAEMNDRAEETGRTGAEAGKRIGQMIDPAERLRIVLGGTGDAAADAAGSFDSLADAVRQANEDFFDNLRAASDFEAALDGIAESVEENGTSLDIHTEKGRANARALQDAARAAEIRRDAMIEDGVNTETANAIFERNIKKLERQAIAAGLSAEKVRGLTRALKRLPPVTDVVVRYQFEQSGTMLGEHSGPRSGERRAAGGPVMAGVPYMINEKGFETVTFPAGGRVHPANLTPMMGAGGGGQTELVLRPAGHTEFERFMTGFISKYVSAYWAGNVQNAYGGKRPLG